MVDLGQPAVAVVLSVERIDREASGADAVFEPLDILIEEILQAVRRFHAALLVERVETATLNKRPEEWVLYGFHGFRDSRLQGNRGSCIGDNHLTWDKGHAYRRKHGTL